TPAGKGASRPKRPAREGGGVAPPGKPRGHRGVHHHGNCGGPGWANGQWRYEAHLTTRDEALEPRTPRDKCYMDHDYCIFNCIKCSPTKQCLSDCVEKCHRKLASCLRSVGHRGLESWAFDTVIPWFH